MRKILATPVLFLLLVHATVTTPRRAKYSNVALKKPAFSSSYWLEIHTADHGNDGRENERSSVKLLTQRSCSWSTSHYNDRTPWWAVDLGSVHLVREITVLHMMSYGKPKCLIVELFESMPDNTTVKDFGVLCTRGIGDLRPIFKKRCQRKAIGRYLRVKKYWTSNNQDVLAVCEYIIRGKKHKIPSKKRQLQSAVRGQRFTTQATMMTTSTTTPTTTTTTTTTTMISKFYGTENKADLSDAKKAQKYHGNVQLPSPFSCSRRPYISSFNQESGFCRCFCHLPLQVFPRKYQKWVGDIGLKCNDLN